MDPSGKDIQPERLPPIEDAIKYHSFRVVPIRINKIM